MPTTRLATFRAAILDGYVDVARFVGLDPFAILAGAQIDPRPVEDPDTPISLRGVVRVLEESARISGRDDFGVLLAESRAFSSLGQVALLMQHEHTTRDILRVAAEFRPLVNECLWIHIEEDHGYAWIQFEVPAQYGSPQFLSHVVAVASAVLVDASGGGWQPDCAHFRHAEPNWKATYAGHFNCSLSFDDTFDGLSCTSAALDARNKSADALLATYARRLLNLCPEMQQKQTTSHRVRTALQLSLRHGQPTLAKVSASLAIRPRTLQKLLADEGETFSGLLRQVRRDLSERYLLHGSQEISEVAYNVGFASPGSFSRWFDHEYGVSPSAWRRLALVQANRPAALR